MAALTAVSPTPLRESLGSLTLLMFDLTTSTSADTFLIQANSPVLRFWATSSSGTATSLDVTWTASTGTFAIASSAQGAITLFVLMRT